MALPAGTVLGHYEILGPLGSGGMGEVYRARDTRLDREVAIKSLPPDMAEDPNRLSRFEKEARLASALNHPNIITVYEIGKSDSISYIAMELVDGKTLREILAGGPMPMAKLVDVATQIAEGLAKAHEAQIVHRDLKPENLMVTTDGFSKILDFGLSKYSPGPALATAPTILAATALTGPGTLLGTVDYMSPEQAAANDTDFRSDQFSFGSILYEMATGVRAFRRGTAVQTMSAIIEHAPTPLESVNPTTPEPLRKIVDRCLAKNPADRYAATRDLAADLKKLSFSLTIGSAGLIAPIKRRRAPAVPVKIALALLALVVAIPALVNFTAIRDWTIQRFSPEPALPEQKNLVVLPFQIKGGDEQNQAFSDGLTEAVTTRLTQLTTIRTLQVAPAREVRTRKVDSADNARRLLGANLVLTGNLEPARQGLQLTLTLFDPASNRQLRTRTSRFDARDPAAIRDAVVDSMIGMLQLKVSSADRQSLAVRDSSVPAARELYIQARGYLQDYDKPENIDRAIAVISDALKLDANYATAHAGLGEAYLAKYGRTNEPTWIAAGQKSCEEALRLDASLGAARNCLGTVYSNTGQYEEAVQELQQAIAIEPTNDDYYRELARIQQKFGNKDDAEKTFRQAISIRPHYWANYNSLGVFYFNNAKYEEASEMFKQVVSLAPDSIFGYSNLGGAYVQLGRYNDAIPMFQRSVAIRPNASAYSNLATAYFNRRRFLESARTFEEAIKLNDKNYAFWGNLADAYYWAPGERERAPDTYRKALDLGMEQLKLTPRDGVLLVRLGFYDAMIGERQPATSFLQRALDVAPQDALVRVYAALIHNQFKDGDGTMEWLQKSVQAGYPVTLIRDAPNFDPLWANPKFQSLLRDH